MDLQSRGDSLAPGQSRSHNDSGQVVNTRACVIKEYTMVSARRQLCAEVER